MRSESRSQVLVAFSASEKWWSDGTTETSYLIGRLDGLAAVKFPQPPGAGRTDILSSPRNGANVGFPPQAAPHQKSRQWAFPRRVVAQERPPEERQQRS